MLNQIKFVYVFSALLWAPIMVHSQNQLPKSPQCQQFSQVLNQQWQQINQIYKKSDLRFKNIDKENSPFFVPGSSSDLVILLHGFLGSPFEMNRLAIPLKNKGYSVLNDLIPGYGFSARIANQFKEDFWDQYFDIRYKSAFKCFKRVHMIGFSTGGLITHKFLMSNPKLRAESVHLISPFFAPTFKFISFLTQWFSLVKTEVPLSLLYVTTFGAKELKMMMLYPDNYLRDAPYLNMNEIVKSGKEVIDSRTGGKNTSPVVLYATSQDFVMDFDVTKNIVARDFVNPRLVDYSKTQAPHHLFRSEVSEVALNFEKLLLSFF